MKDYRLARTTGEYLKIRWDAQELDHIKTIKARLGVKNTPDIVRMALMNEYKRVMGTPMPKEKH